MPWGWVALDGRRWLPPQHGPLSAALLQDSSGALRWIRGDNVARVATEPGIAWAFQHVIAAAEAADAHAAARLERSRRGLELRGRVFELFEISVSANV